MPLLQFRLKKTLPYDIDSAVISYFTQPLTKAGKREVVAVATPLEVIARYEAPFRAANIHAGIVTISHLAMLDLVAPTGVVIVAKLSGGILTVMAIDHGILRLVRSLELTEIDARRNRRRSLSHVRLLRRQFRLASRDPAVVRLRRPRRGGHPPF